MKKYLIILFNIFVIFLVLSCDLDDFDSNEIDRNTKINDKLYKIKIDEQRPYNFKIPVKTGELPTKNNHRIFLNYKNDGDYLEIIENLKTGLISIKKITYSKEGGVVKGGLTLKIKKEEIENFKNAMINGGSFKYINKNFVDKNESLTIIYDENISKDYVFLDLECYSLAIPLSELRKHITLK